MILASTSVHVVEQTPQNECLSCLCHQGKLHFPPASPGDSKNNKVSPNCCFCPEFQSIWNFLCTLLKWSLCFPQSSGFPEIKLLIFKVKHLRVSSSCAGFLGWEAYGQAQTPRSLMGKFSAVIILRVISIDNTVSPLLLPISLWFLYIFSYRIYFLVDSSLSHQQLLINNCNFGLHMRVGKLWVFLLCHLVAISNQFKS